MSTLLKWSQVQQLLQAKNLKFVTPQILSQLIPAKTHQIKHFFETQAIAGTLIRLKPGLYITQINPPSETEIANRLYSPSYISLEYALAFYGILPEMVYTITSLTTKPTRTFSPNHQVYLYRSIQKAAYTGYSLHEQNETSFYIAEPEKALVDYLYFSILDHRPINDRLNQIKNLNLDIINTYSALYNQPQLKIYLSKIL